MKFSAFIALVGVSAQAPADKIFFDENLTCDDFQTKLESFYPDMKTKCKTKHNKKRGKTKTWCNLICNNGQENYYAVRPLRVASFL